MKKVRLVSQGKVETESILSKLSSLELLFDDGVFIKKIEGKNCKVAVFVAEDYYLRIDSTLTMTVIIQETAEKTTVDIISSGGKTSWYGISYGAEKSAAKRIVQLLKDDGFIEQ